MILHFMYGDKDLFSVESSAVPAPGDIWRHEVINPEEPFRVTSRWIVLDMRREWRSVENRPAAFAENRHPRIQYVIVEVAPTDERR